MRYDEDLSKLSRETLDWLWSQIYEPADRGLQKAIRRICFARFAEPLTTWPAATVDPDRVHWAHSNKLGPDHLVYYCRAGSGYKDPAHQPVRSVRIPSDIKPPFVECSCGKVALLWDHAREQRYETPLVWPIEKISGIYYFVGVCSQAERPFDAKHAPYNNLPRAARCICGWTLDREMLADRGLMLKRFDAH